MQATYDKLAKRVIQTGVHIGGRYITDALRIHGQAIASIERWIQTGASFTSHALMQAMYNRGGGGRAAGAAKNP